MCIHKANPNDALSIAAMRATVIDMTNTANSGHPGMALGSAPLVFNLYRNHLKIDPRNPNWVARDRFVLSAGHASALLYTALHFAGYKVTLDDLKNFRQLNSITPGHPEYGLTPGVDATTGPLGQGLANAVGMAVAEEALVARYPKYEKLLQHYTYALVGDGCLQEGISQEAISFAGHQKLNKLIVFYDANDVTLDGPLSDSFSEDTAMRFKASGWSVFKVEDGNNLRAIDKAIRRAKRSDSPSLIIVKTIIGQGSRHQGTAKVHGSPLGENDGNFAKGTYNYTNMPFEIPLQVYEHMETGTIKRGMKAYDMWYDGYLALKEDDTVEAKDLITALEDDVKPMIDKIRMNFEDELSEASRSTSGNILAAFNNNLPHLMGGSADVASSVMTKISGESNFTSKNRRGRNINFGIREFAMGAIGNGMMLHGGIRPYVGTFLVFSDYMKNSIRLAALSNLPMIYLFSHDSVLLGEDGPTHQPIEHLAMLRAMPNLNVWRPADARETLVAWQEAVISKNTPHALILSRQKLPIISGSSDLNLIRRGGYIVSKEDGRKKLDFIVIATGSEVNLAIRAQRELVLRGYNIRVVSMPSIELFRKQDEAYQKEVLSLKKDRRIVVEILSSMGWHEYADHMMCVDHFGYSAPMKDIVTHLSYTDETLARRIEGILDPSSIVPKEVAPEFVEEELHDPLPEEEKVKEAAKEKETPAEEKPKQTKKKKAKQD